MKRPKKRQKRNRYRTLTMVDLRGNNGARVQVQSEPCSQDLYMLSNIVDNMARTQYAKEHGR